MFKFIPFVASAICYGQVYDVPVMKKRPPRSLKRPLIVQPLLLSFVILITTFSLIVVLLLQAAGDGPVADETVAVAAARAVVRTSGGELAVGMTPELSKLKAETPDLWFVAEDSAGRSVSFGPVPQPFTAFDGLRHLSFGEIRDREAPHSLSAVIRRAEGPAGRLSVLAHGKVVSLTPAVVLISNIVVILIFLALAIASVIMTPWIVNKALAGLSRIAQEAREIEIDRQPMQLSEELAPTEIIPLVTAMNEALRRLNDGYLRQRRFIAAAAHELRTPIAILRVKIEASDEQTSARFNGDVVRLANLAEQLLDLHRVEDDGASELVDLGALTRNVVGDIAPLLIAEGKSIEANTEAAGSIIANVGAIERILTNLILNAAEHGGRNLKIRIEGSRLDVEDDGPGIPPEERDRLFEPFQRLRPRSTGAGLGLHLVKMIVDRYGGSISIRDVPTGGIVFHVEFPSPAEDTMFVQC